jgi:hypothetical protein
MFEENNDERDENLDTEDTDLENENSEDEEEADETDEEEDAEDDKELSDEEKAKPLTQGQFREWQKAQAKSAAKDANKSHAAQRVASKKGGALLDKAPKLNDRLSSIEQNQAKLDLLERKRQFAYENNLSPAETDTVFKMTKRPTTKFLQTPFVKAGLAAIRSSLNVRANTPGSGGRVVTKVGDKNFNDLTPAEKQANFADRQRQIIEAKKKQ